MKTNFKIFFFLLVALTTSTVFKVHGQITAESGIKSINAGLAFGLDMEKLGLRAGMSYFLDENMRVGGDLTYWFTGEESSSFMGVSSSVSTTAYEVNGHFHYIFFNENNLIIYGIGALGLHYAKAKVSVSGTGIIDGDTSSSNSEIGLGIGAGVEYFLENVSLFAEPKYFLTGFEQLKLSAGVRIYF
jgi:opacity protein-like surface antigen